MLLTVANLTLYIPLLKGFLRVSMVDFASLYDLYGGWSILVFKYT